MNTDPADYEEELEQEFRHRSEQVVKRQRYSRRPKKARSIVNRLLARKGLVETQANQALQQRWKELAGSQAAAQTRLGHLRKGVLQIFVNNAALKHYLQMNEKQLREGLAQHNSQIQAIRFRVD